MYVSGPSQKTPVWYQERAVRLTGSNWYSILKGKEKPSGLVGRRQGSKFSEMCKAYGDRYEKAALRSVQTFLNPSGLRIEEAKFYIPQSHPFLGTTPDGIIVKDNEIDSVVEVKCPYNSRWTGQRPKWIQQWDLWFGAIEPVLVSSPGPDVCHWGHAVYFWCVHLKNDMDRGGAKGPTIY